MKKTIISAALLTALFMSCTPSDDKTTTNSLTIENMEKEDKQQIEVLLNTYKTSLNTSDANLAVSLYTKDGVFMPSEAPSAIGTANIKGAYEYVFSQIQLNIEFYIEEIVIEGSLAFATTTSKGSTLIRAINTTVPEENRELFVFEKENNEWKIARYMFNKMSPKK